MSPKSLCRLCVCSRDEYRSLYDECGQGNEVYEITLKYFDPMLLSPDNERDSTVICLDCWSHISEFYRFQQSVLQAQADFQALIHADLKESYPDVKLENEVLLEQLPIEVIQSSDSTTAEGVLKHETSMSDDEAQCNMDDNPFSSSDDEKPLISSQTNSKKAARKKRKSENNCSGYTRKHSRTKTESCKSTAVHENTVNKRRTPRKTASKDSLKDCDNLEKNEKEDTILINNVSDDGHDTSLCNDKKSVKDKTLECDAFIAQWKEELECVCCPQTVKNFTLLRKHYRTEHPQEKCYVICCQRKFYHRFHIVEHIRLHIDPNVFKCSECGKCSTNSRNLAKHKREMHTEEGKQRPFECEVCHKRFSNKTILRTHMEVHENGRDHICGECGKGFPSENRRKIHERMVHQADRICDQCGKTVHGVYALKLHLLEHAGIQKPKWPCDQCKAQLHSHSSLKRHKLITHHDGSTVYICSDCGKIFTSENALRSHKRIVHLIERKYKCNICEKAFKFPKILREHMASHTGEDLYQCPYCPKTFKVSANMHHHRKKAHPKEWAEARINKPVSNKVNINLVSNEIIM